MARSEPPAQRQNTFAAISQELVLHIEQLCLTLHEAEKDGIATLFEHVMHRNDSLLARVTDQTEHMRRHFALFEEVSVDFPHLFIFVLHFLLFDKFFVFGKNIWTVAMLCLFPFGTLMRAANGWGGGVAVIRCC